MSLVEKQLYNDDKTLIELLNLTTGTTRDLALHRDNTKISLSYFTQQGLTATIVKILQSYNTRIAHKLVITLRYLLNNVEVDLPRLPAS